MCRSVRRCSYSQIVLPRPRHEFRLSFYIYSNVPLFPFFKPLVCFQLAFRDLHVYLVFMKDGSFNANPWTCPLLRQNCVRIPFLPTPKPYHQLSLTIYNRLGAPSDSRLSRRDDCTEPTIPSDNFTVSKYFSLSLVPAQFSLWEWDKFYSGKDWPESPYLGYDYETVVPSNSPQPAAWICRHHRQIQANSHPPQRRLPGSVRPHHPKIQLPVLRRQ